jgi:hypothetical protein
VAPAVRVSQTRTPGAFGVTVRAYYGALPSMAGMGPRVRGQKRPRLKSSLPERRRGSGRAKVPPLARSPEARSWRLKEERHRKYAARATARPAGALEQRRCLSLKRETPHEIHGRAALALRPLSSSRGRRTIPRSPDVRPRAERRFARVHPSRRAASQRSSG